MQHEWSFAAMDSYSFPDLADVSNPRGQPLSDSDDTRCTSCIWPSAKRELPTFLVVNRETQWLEICAPRIAVIWIQR
jgi:hypothetical protein